MTLKAPRGSSWYSQPGQRLYDANDSHWIIRVFEAKALFQMPDRWRRYLLSDKPSVLQDDTYQIDVYRVHNEHDTLKGDEGVAEVLVFESIAYITAEEAAKLIFTEDAARKEAKADALIK